MAKYKGREVRIIKELPSTIGDQVQIEHIELSGTEIVPLSQVTVSEDEMKEIKKARELREKEGYDNDFQIEGETTPSPLPSSFQVQVQRQAEDNLERAEKQAKENEEWQKKHPKAQSGAKQQLDAIKVVPYKDEAPKSDKTWYGKDKK